MGVFVGKHIFDRAEIQTYSQTTYIVRRCKFCERTTALPKISLKNMPMDMAKCDYSPKKVINFPIRVVDCYGGDSVLRERAAQKRAGAEG